MQTGKKNNIGTMADGGTAALKNNEYHYEQQQDNADEFSGFYLFPHEYLSLVCNAKDRQSIIRHLPKPNMDMSKKYRATLADA